MRSLKSSRTACVASRNLKEFLILTSRRRRASGGTVRGPNGNMTQGKNGSVTLKQLHGGSAMWRNVRYWPRSYSGSSSGSDDEWLMGRYPITRATFVPSEAMKVWR